MTVPTHTSPGFDSALEHFRTTGNADLLRQVLCVPASDHGQALALTLAEAKLAEVERALRNARLAFDRDEINVSFTVEHHPSCRGGHAPERCACGLSGTVSDLLDAERELDGVRRTLDRIVAQGARRVQS